MKKTLHALLLMLAVLFNTALLANAVVVKGTIKDSLNHPLANKQVTIYSADSAGCNTLHTVSTNANGYYIDTLTCTNNIAKVFAVVENCSGVRIQSDRIVGATGVAEINFTLCSTTPPPPPASCKAVFTFTQAPNGVKFTAGASTAPPGDSIISYTWEFGDTTIPVKGTRDPLHVYTKAGVYNVCVTIKTKNGCESRYCTTVEYKPAQVSCKATAAFTVEKIGPKKFRFNSTQSSTLSGDSLFQRIWQFGDGSSMDGNKPIVEKEFKNNGTYSVCLKVVSVKGCDNSTCTTVTVKDTVPPPTTNCKAYFTYSIKDSVVTFNSAASVASSAPGDSIISRTWSYSDSVNNVSLDGNVVAPSYKYFKPGAYKVTLVIKTKLGCESRVSVLVVIQTPPPPVSCKASFTYSIKDSVVTFNSAASQASSAPGDSIISRTWSYSDSVNNVSLDGNVVAPSYKYFKPGTYKVTLVIKTKMGCESRVSVPVVIPTPPPPAACKASFIFQVQEKGTVKFKSTSTGAGLLDSILQYTWIFGDSTAPKQGGIDPTHVYAKSGKYSITLLIKTKSGCESKYTETVTIQLAPPPVCNVNAQFTATRVSVKKVQFNSSASRTAAGDSIIQRSWKFGDGSVLNGNEAAPVKEFAQPGIYNVCLEVKTAGGCIAQTCQSVTVQDTVTAPQSSVDYLKIISINPNPVTTRMMATIYSRNTNTEAEIVIYDIYGTPKRVVKKLLAQGNTVVEIPTGDLRPGPYFLKVGSRGAKDSKAFYKL